MKPDQLSYIRGRLYNRKKKAEGGRADRDLSGGQNAHPKTAEILAQAHGVNEKTIRRDGKRAEALDKLAVDMPEDAQARRPARQSRLNDAGGMRTPSRAESQLRL